jgi:hypothetical protein
MPRFTDSWKRIDRALLHGRAISKGWKSIFDPFAQPEIERRGETQYVAKVKLKREDSNDLSLELGEYVYQLRAALDGVAFEVMVLETSDPPPKENRVEFPIYDDPERFKNAPFIKYPQFPLEVKDWLESLQPYNLGKSSDPDTNELTRRLKLLHALSRKDRHRRLHVVIGALSELKPHFRFTPNITISNVQPIPIDFMGDSTDFLSFDAVCSDGKASNITLITMGQIEFGIADIDYCFGQETMNELERLMLATRNIVQVFEMGYPL